ncbi:gamma carbonic anhydrase family protein [Aurantiacibacter flavus]|uniref:Gamma carbonic anhydrase family protein n=1 Tax=Aurantiacibacter flavus TaxID=3145232 RepID=A0ABV0CVW1_9SPHN
MGLIISPSCAHRAVLPTQIGEDALIGHMALLHGCTVADRGFVGMGAIVMDGCAIGSQAILAAGALLPPGKAVPAGELWTGRPALQTRALSEQEIAGMASQTAHHRDGEP